MDVLLIAIKVRKGFEPVFDVGRQQSHRWKTQRRAKLRLTLVKKSELPKWSVTGLHRESEFGAGRELYLLMLSADSPLLHHFNFCLGESIYKQTNVNRNVSIVFLHCF